jgi:hypothetical protein
VHKKKREGKRIGCASKRFQESSQGAGVKSAGSNLPEDSASFVPNIRKKRGSGISQPSGSDTGNLY